ncbi:nicotinamidase-like amidase [Synechococcus sp. PCC 7502]|uniref:cysteine hydrolase family protein n=1 Tax=Synechococcus sp. PCC 7502 TaxID=1173263 RepID=UPI00029FA4B8|nr:isochorismatase family cysteine hydrolase [Synechococcus sp. PCC 7502]AFY74877.1 nicotinamidase-like amidase [Synechococcus sp. PCC 7502]
MLKSSRPAQELILVPTRQHDFPLVLGKTALLVIDMQNGFCHPEGFCGHELGADLSAVRQIIPNIQAAIAWAREQGLLIIYTRESHLPDLSDVTPSKAQRYINAGYPIGSLGKMGRFLIQGELGTNLIAEIQPLDSELQIDKPAQSIFIGTELDKILAQRNITHLLFTGVTTACCVLASYRQASDLGFYTLLLEDCCGAMSPVEHQAAIDVILTENGAIGWVTSFDNLREFLGR